jgi:hypothetical protein
LHLRGCHHHDWTQLCPEIPFKSCQSTLAASDDRFSTYSIKGICFIFTNQLSLTIQLLLTSAQQKLNKSRFIMAFLSRPQTSSSPSAGRSESWYKSDEGDHGHFGFFCTMFKQVMNLCKITDYKIIGQWRHLFSLSCQFPWFLLFLLNSLVRVSFIYRGSHSFCFFGCFGSLDGEKTSASTIVWYCHTWQWWSTVVVCRHNSEYILCEDSYHCHCLLYIPLI